MKSLHFLPVKFHIEFKIALLTHKCLHGYAPTYSKNLINSRSVSARYSWRVNDDNWLLQTVTSLNFARSQSLVSCASPKVWNSLPLSLREIETLSLFNKRSKAYYWNDRPSRRVFLCFYSAIFQLTSAKFQTFAYNSRTVWSSYMKFSQQFEINELYVCTQFGGNRSRDFGFRTRKPPRKFGVKSGLIEKQLKGGESSSQFRWFTIAKIEL